MSDKRKALFIDRDGTINYDSGYIHEPDKIKIYADAQNMIKNYKSLGYIIIIVTNQSGIGRKYFTEKDCITFNKELSHRLSDNGAVIDNVYHCPHIPEDNCNCRKPKTGLIEMAVNDYNIDLKNSIVVGDRDDIEGEMARRLGIKYIILGGDRKFVD